MLRSLVSGLPLVWNRRWPGSPAARARPDDRARPYVTDPENETPGRPRLYATGVPFRRHRPAGAGRDPHGGRPSSKAIPITPPVGAPPTLSPRRRCLIYMIPSARRRPRAKGDPVSWADLDTALAGPRRCGRRQPGRGFPPAHGRRHLADGVLRQIALLLAKLACGALARVRACRRQRPATPRLPLRSGGASSTPRRRSTAPMR